MTKFKRDFYFDENIIKTVAYNVIKYRKLNKITQEQLAIDIGVSPEFIRKFESTRGSEGLSILSLYKYQLYLIHLLINSLNQLILLINKKILY